MSARFDLDSENLSRSSPASVIDYNKPYTAMFWFQSNFDREDWTYIFDINSSLGGSNNYDCITTYNGAFDLCIEQTIESSAPAYSVAYTIVLNQWYHVAMVRRSATSLLFYVNGKLISDTLSGTSPVSVASRTASGAIGVNSNLWGQDWDGRMAGVKLWSTALSSKEVMAETKQLTPAKRERLFGFYPLLSGSNRTLDYSGFGRHLTQGGSPTDADNPPVPWEVIKPKTFVDGLKIPLPRNRMVVLP